MRQMIQHVHGRSLVIVALLGSSAVCQIISALPAIDFASQRMGKSRYVVLNLFIPGSSTYGSQVCLFDDKEVSLRDKLRDGASDASLMQVIGQAVSGKQEKHVQMEDINVTTNRPMILIGG